MTYEIEKYMYNLNEEEKIEFLKKCFYLDIKSKKNRTQPFKFVIRHRNFSHNEVRILSKRYLDNYANEKEVDLYYDSLEKSLETLSPYIKSNYDLYKKIFNLFLENDFYSISFLTAIRKIKFNFEELLEIPIRYDSLFANKEEREKFKKLNLPSNIDMLKISYYYNFCNNQKWNYDSIYSLSLITQRPVSYILSMCNRYANQFLGIRSLKEVDDIRNKYIVKSTPSDELIKNFFLILENANTKQEIINCYSSISLDINLLSSQIDSYVNTYKRDLSEIEKQLLIKNLKRKIQIYKKYLEEERRKKQEKIKKEYEIKRKEDMLPLAKDTILKFINQDSFDQENFCKFLGITLNSFDEMLLLIKENDNELYEKYLKKEKEKIEEAIRVAKIMIQKIKFGVLEENNRKFNLLDYFNLTKLPFSKMREICKDRIEKDEYYYLESFFFKNRKLTRMDDKIWKEVLQEKVILGVELDSDNNIIPNSGHFVTEEEKVSVINELLANKIPLYYQVYQLQLRKMFDSKEKKCQKYNK